MAKEEGAKTVVLGGKKDVQQEYCGMTSYYGYTFRVLNYLPGTVGGQSTDFLTIGSEIEVRLWLIPSQTSLIFLKSGCWAVGQPVSPSFPVNISLPMSLSVSYRHDLGW